MSNEVLVSIILPVYNTEKYLSQCIESILCQSLKKIEIICIDDGSTDSSLEILNCLASRESRIHIYQQENKGAGAARNYGLNIAVGEYVAFMDSDDWYQSVDVLEDLYRTAKRENVLICGGGIARYMNGVYTTLEDECILPTDQKLDYRDYQFHFYFTRFIYNLSMIRKNHIFFPEYRLFEDPPFLVHTMAVVRVFYMIPKLVYCYRGSHKRNIMNPQKINDLVRGLIDVILLSKEHQFANLHYFILKKMNTEYLSKLVFSITPDNLEIVILLIRANNVFDIELLKQCDEFKYTSNSTLFIEALMIKIYRNNIWKFKIQCYFWGLNNNIQKLTFYYHNFGINRTLYAVKNWIKLVSK